MSTTEKAKTTNGTNGFSPEKVAEAMKAHDAMKATVAEKHELVASEESPSSTRDDGSYTIRDMILFRDFTIPPAHQMPANKHIIRIVPNHGERVLLARIFMHKTAAESLVIERLAVGERVLTSGAGTCEIFLASIPNWTPQDIYIDEKNPLTIAVSNMRNFPIRAVGSVAVFRKAGQS